MPLVLQIDVANHFVSELRIVGLFTSDAYTQSVLTIPILRRKVETVIRRQGFDPYSHSGTALVNVLEHNTVLSALRLTLNPGLHDECKVALVAAASVAPRGPPPGLRLLHTP